MYSFFFFQAEDGIRDKLVTGVQTCALPILGAVVWAGRAFARAPRLARLAAPALVATLVTAPISAFAFGTVAPIGVLANLIAIPLGGVAVPGLVMALALSWLDAGLARLIRARAGLGLALLDLVAHSAALVQIGRASCRERV